ncbi:MAG: phenylacetate-CoA oxygenase subunit PaaI [Ardenticatenaceae bacterium]|nr:phenylacetate-CoA oxygenase subunit PaaI [Ardenticatenaceae bacterium]
MKTYQHAEEMPAALAEAVLAWTLSVADTKHRMGIQFSRWVTGTPALEAAVGSAAITQDELGHARSLYGLLRHFPHAPEAIGAENDLEAREVYYAPAALQPAWDSWLQVVAINVTLDRALQVAIAATADSAFQPLAGRTAKILQEEQFHRVFGDEWLVRLMERGNGMRGRLATAVSWAYNITSTWLGPNDDAITNTLYAAGVLNADAATLRQRWLAEVEPVLAKCGLVVAAEVQGWEGWNGRFRHKEQLSS